MLRRAAVRDDGQTKAPGESESPLASPPYSKADDVGRPRLGRVLVKIGVAVHVQQLERQVELVVQGHPAHCPGQRGLLGGHLLHAGQAVPGLAWRNQAHVISAPVLETG
jgi:hypothetical protein